MLKSGGIQSKTLAVLIHILIWAVLLFLPVLVVESLEAKQRFMHVGWFILVMMAISFYLNSHVLIPNLLLKKKPWLYALALAMTMLVIMAISTGYFEFLEFLRPNRHHPHHLYRLALIPFAPCVVAIAFSSVIKISTEWYKNEKQKKEMEAEKLTSELAFLKSQINPHFLFNNLNNICSLARKKSDDTENAIIKLSQIMRYMLQDSKNEKVSLDKEVEYLQNYIELQRLRISDQVNIEMRTEGETSLIGIEPLLLIPFIENAFKHGISYKEDSSIRIFLKVIPEKLFLHVENTIFRNRETEAATISGIGLKNVLRRLDLLYPGKHELTINEEGNTYMIELIIHFTP